MTMTWRTAVGVAAFGLLTSGCLVKEEEHTWYLDPSSGTITWTVFERDVRSNEKDPAARLAEEAEFWSGVQSETHRTARGFRALGAVSVRTRILRDEVPFSLVTDAALPAIHELGRLLIEGGGGIGTSALERDGDAWVWTLTVRCPKDGEAHPEENGDIGGLLSLETLRVVLPRGRFESAVGFELDADRRVAVLLDQEGLDEDTGIVLSLRWVVEP